MSERGPVVWLAHNKTWSLYPKVESCTSFSPIVSLHIGFMFSSWAHNDRAYTECSCILRKALSSWKRQCLIFPRQNGDCAVHRLHIVSIVVNIFSFKKHFILNSHTHNVIIHHSQPWKSLIQICSKEARHFWTETWELPPITLEVFSVPPSCHSLPSKHWAYLGLSLAFSRVLPPVVTILKLLVDLPEVVFAQIYIFALPKHPFTFDCTSFTVIFSCTFVTIL